MSPLPDHMALTSILVREKRALEGLHDAHVQMRLLLGAGHSRYLGWAVDDLAEATNALTEIDRARRSVTGVRTAEQCIDTAPDALRRTLIRLTDEVDVLLRRVEREREKARSSCHGQTGGRAHR